MAGADRSAPGRLADNAKPGPPTVRRGAGLTSPASALASPVCREYDPSATDAALPLLRCEESGGLLGELADGWASPVGGRSCDEPGQVADAAGRVDLPAQGLHRPGGQGGGVVDLGLVLTQVDRGHG